MSLAVIASPRFSIEGTVQEVIYKKALPKVIALETVTGTLWVKLQKSLRRQLATSPKVGDRLRLSGEICSKKEAVQKCYKANHLEILAIAAPEEGVVARPCKVLICQKSSCCRRGAKQLWQELEQQAIAQQLPICLKATGCLGECKRGPAVVVLPHKKRLTRAKTAQITELVCSAV